jgi:hypothetical protein
MDAPVATRKLLHLAAALGIPAIGLTLWSWGQPLICTCGTVRLWIGSIWSTENSQQIADWYTLAHMMHGLAVILVGRLLFRRVSFNTLYLVAIATLVARDGFILEAIMLVHQFEAIEEWQLELKPDHLKR